ncbi:MAG TPA: tetratricopeptide repeat protein [Terriglobales bacterium]|nr:tetratricopeptide repeat protein [Terriglobales bacterium]
MVLGFGFNKTKVLAAAEKYVQQGKLQNAINEYLKVAKEDPKELTVLNTIGDLYARLGQTEQAISYFKKVGDSYAGGGFTVKAIAMYKKITKLSNTSTDCILRMAELYTQQGLYSDARAHYMQVADLYMRVNELQQAAKIFQKMLELDPENAAMQSKLADLYLRLDKKDEARNIFFSAAQSLYQRGAHDSADEALGRVLRIEPTNTAALLLRGKIAVETGDSAAAVKHLEQIPNIDSRPEALTLLLKARLMTGNLGEAEPVAKKLLTVHNDPAGITAYAEALMTGGNFEGALRVYENYADRLLKGNAAATLRALHGSIARIKENPAALEMLLSLYQRAGESTNLGEVTELLAHAYVQTNQLAKARDLYQELAKMEPENALHMQHYRQMVSKLGEDPATRELSKEEGSQAFMVDELEITAPNLVQEYDELTGDAIKAALTDSELLDSYNMPQKAIDPLEAALPKAPRDARMNHRLASLYVRAGRYADAARCCSVLSEVYSEAGFADQATQYGEMATRYRARGPAEPVSAVAAAAEFAVEAPAAEPPPKAQPTHKEIDLSSEWESMAVAEPEPGTPEAEEAAKAKAAAAEAAAAEAAAKAAARAAPVASTVTDLLDEARFYISQGMWNEARSALAKAAESAPESTEIRDLRAQIEAGSVPAQVAPEPVAPVVEAAPPPPPPAGAAPPPAPQRQAAAAASTSALGDLVSDLESSLGDDFAVAEPPAPAKPAAKAPAAPPPAPPAAPAGAPVSAAAAAAEEKSVLSDLFEEFKEGVEEATPEDEDPQTHYNLGVAFKEMGLLDEAIGELQKVCRALDNGAEFSDRVQAYTWLANCFVEKGVPQASIKWFERAIKSPGVDEETRMAIRYEMGAAHEAAGDKKAALQQFMEVYGSNIDYRDVAERIKALRA